MSSVAGTLNRGVGQQFESAGLTRLTDPRNFVGGLIATPGANEPTTSTAFNVGLEIESCTVVVTPKRTAEITRSEVFVNVTQASIHGSDQETTNGLEMLTGASPGGVE
jgi:hypothetical protein